MILRNIWLLMDLTVISFMLAANNHTCRLENNYWSSSGWLNLKKKTYHLPFNTFLRKYCRFLSSKRPKTRSRATWNNTFACAIRSLHKENAKFMVPARFGQALIWLVVTDKLANSCVQPSVWGRSMCLFPEQRLVIQPNRNVN